MKHDPAGRSECTVLSPQLETQWQKSKLDELVLRLYEKHRLTVTSDTRPRFTDSDLIQPVEVLGSGVFNTVYAARLRGPGSEVEGIFKPLEQGMGGASPVASRSGIPRADPQFAMRNLATNDYAKLLHFDVIPDTMMAVLSAPDKNSSTHEPKLGILMERAPGFAAGRQPMDMFLRSDTIREVTKLQLLDHLTAQGDRHSSNYHVAIVGNDQVKVTGIDNDLSFGERLRNPEDIRRGETKERRGFKGTSLPPVVDHDMAASIRSIEPDELRRILESKLSPGEVDAALERLDRVKAHIDGLERQGRVVHPDQWDDVNVRNHLVSANSYAARELVKAAIREEPAVRKWISR